MASKEAQRTEELAVMFDTAHTLDLARVRQMKPRLPPEFFEVTTGLMIGMSLWLGLWS